MAFNWGRRHMGEEPPDYLPTAELFSIRLHYMVGETEGMAGYIDYCCADQMSRLELISMGIDCGLDVQGCSVWWLDVFGEEKGLKEIKTDLDAFEMAMTVGPAKEVCVYIKLASISCPDINNQGGFNDGEGVNPEKISMVALLEDVEEDDAVEDVDLEDILVGEQGQAKTVNEENDFHDSDYSFNGDTDTEDRENVTRHNTEVEAEQQAKGIGSDTDVETNYAISEELHSCSSTDEDELVSTRPNYAEFNDGVDMKDPHFKIGMKFKSFKQFREAVRNYGIKNRYVMNFKPNNNKKCKAFCRKGCPFYLWASPMVMDKNTIQIKSGNLEHECARDHVNRHVNAQWIANNYLEQFRADPSWKISGIIQAVKTNQAIDISRLKAHRAKCIAQRLIDGDEESQMTRLHDYQLELLKTHPGSTIIVRCNDEGVFEALYICLAPLREGFLAGCRHLISVDGCFLKGLYGGQLLTAVGIDANDCIYPICWATVKKENKANWTWFLQVLAQDLRINDNKQWCFMSDRQKVISIPVEISHEARTLKDHTTTQASKEPVSQVSINNLQTYNVEERAPKLSTMVGKKQIRLGKEDAGHGKQPLTGTHLRRQAMNPMETKNTKSDTKETRNASKVAQRKHKDSTEGSKVEDAEKRRRVWLPPGSGPFAG